MSQQINRKGWLVRSLNLLNTELSVKRTGTKSPGGWERGRLHPTLHCHHHSGSYIKTGSDGSRSKVLTMNKITRLTIHRPQRLKREESRSGIEPSPSAYQHNALITARPNSLTERVGQTLLIDIYKGLTL